MERDNLSKIEAEKVFVEEVAKAQARFNTNKELRSIDQKIIQLSRSKSKSAFSKIIDLKKQKEEIKAKIAKEDNPLGNPYEVFNKAIARPLGELLIGLVFSPSTVIINTVPSLMKTIYKPFINYVAKSPLDGAAFKGMTAEYSAMWSMIPTALKSARFAFIHEQAILTGNYNRLFETVQDHALPGWFGQAVRLFPRSLLATDAFFEQINYKGYIVGSRTAQAIEEGQALNYSGKKLNDYVSKEVTKAVNKAYDGQPNVVDELVDVAIKKGLSGKKADIWARKQLANNKDIFRKAQNQEGKSYVQDLLFKRDFSGKGFMSKSAQTYESFVQKHPVMRLAGQLFFRTPVRVFEEGLRLTPGLNVINPRFIADLRGKNGLARQVRANGEAMLSYAMVGAIFTLYMQGKITGAGPKDYKQKKMLTMSGGKEPYSIELTDGTDWVYRNFDPFATPIKIIVNALEQAELVKYRTEQGENIDNTTFENSVGAVAIGFMSIAQAIRDANLTGGIKEMTTLFEDLQDPESSGDLIKYTARKMQSFIPSTWFKYKQLEDFQFSDPKTFEQFIQYRYNPGDPRVPRRYSPLGIPEELSSPMTKFNIFDPITREERFANRSDVEIKAEKYLYKLSQVLDTNFIPPYKMEKYFGDKDLRELKLEDGTTVYDRWQQLIRESRLSQAIAQIADRNPPYSTPSNKSESIALTLVNEQISMFREIALLQILRDMPQLKDKYREFIQTDTLDKVLDMSGQSDVNPPNLNY